MSSLPSVKINDIEANPQDWKPRRDFPGFWRGTVIDNMDPQQLGRLKVLVFQIYTEIEDVAIPWAEPGAFPFAGYKNLGAVAIPPVGATVWVAFEQNDPDFPIWFGGYYGKPGGEIEYPLRARGATDPVTVAGLKGTGLVVQAVTALPKVEPQDPFAADYPHNHVVRTENGLLIEWDDTPGKQRILLEHPSGAFIEIHPDGSMVIKAKGMLPGLAKRWDIVSGEHDHQVLGEFNSMALTWNALATTIMRLQGLLEVLIRSEDVTLGQVGDTFLKLVNKAAMDKYNAHVHGSSSGPSPLWVEDVDTTKHTRAG